MAVVADYRPAVNVQAIYGLDYSPRQVVCGLIGWEAGSVCVSGGVCFRLGLVVVGDQAFASLFDETSRNVRALSHTSDADTAILGSTDVIVPRLGQI